MSATTSPYNLKNPAVKRILKEVKEVQEHGGREFWAEPLEENLFEWHFAIRGPPDTEFDGGVYHGRILLPPEYPFKPPSFMFLTPNEGALGSLEYTKEEREKLAQQSRSKFPTYGNEERQVVSQRVHELMLSKEGEACACVHETKCPEGREKQSLLGADDMTLGEFEMTPHHEDDRKISGNASSRREEDLVQAKVEDEKGEAQGGIREMHDGARGSAGPALEAKPTSSQDQSTESMTDFPAQENKGEEDQDTAWLDANEQEEIEPQPETPTTPVRQAESMLLGHARELDDRSLLSITVAVAVALLAVITKKLLKAVHEISLQP